MIPPIHLYWTHHADFNTQWMQPHIERANWFELLCPYESDGHNTFANEEPPSAWWWYCWCERIECVQQNKLWITQRCFATFALFSFCPLAPICVCFLISECFRIPIPKHSHCQITEYERSASQITEIPNKLAPASVVFQTKSIRNRVAHIWRPFH